MGCDAEVRGPRALRLEPNRLGLVGSLDELEQVPATLRPGDRLPFPVLTLAEPTERVQVVVSWKDEAGPHQESFTVQLP